MKKIMFNDKYCLTQAVLSGKKTVTRRICKIQPPSDDYEIVFPVFESDPEESVLNYAFGWRNIKTGHFTGWNKPTFLPDEIISIAQSYKDIDRFHRNGKNKAYLEYLDSMLPEIRKLKGWDNKMFVGSKYMPYKIKITDVGIQRLQDISKDDCMKEGVTITMENNRTRYCLRNDYHKTFGNARSAFAYLIDRLTGKCTFDSNPFVWVYEFELLR